MNGVALDDELKDVYRWAVTVGFGELRPWVNDFFNRFPQVPAFPDWPTAEKSLFTNLLYYRANYIAFLGLLFLLGMFWTPLLLLAVALGAGIALVVLRLPVRALPAAAQKYALPVKSLQHRAVIASLLVLLLLGLTGTFATLMWILLFGTTCIVAHSALRPVKRTAQVHEMLAKLQMTWVAPPQSAESAGEDGEMEGGLRASGGAATFGSDGPRARGGSGHGMVASSTPVALRGMVGSSAAPAPAVDDASLPRPGARPAMADVPLHGDGVQRRPGHKVD